MRKLATAFFLGILALPAMAQRFHPYHAFGVEFNLDYNDLTTMYDGDLNSEHVEYSDLTASTLRFDIYGSYDYGMLKWLGISSGLGFSLRGGAAESYRHPNNPVGRRDLYYLTIPVRLQFKTCHFFWLEPGIEAQYLLGHKDVNFQNDPNDPYPLPFNADELHSFNLVGTASMRFNIFRGLSLNAGYHMDLMPVAKIDARSPSDPSATITYKDFGAYIGLRYMFNQPE